jgi:hypothetical protein
MASLDMIFLLCLLFTPFSLSIGGSLLRDLTLAAEVDAYGIGQDDGLFGTDSLSDDLFASYSDTDYPDDAGFLDGTFDLDDFNVVNSLCSPQGDQWSRRVRARQQCDVPSGATGESPPMVMEEIPSVVTGQEPRCDDGEEHLCCKGEVYRFWNGFRSIVSGCIKCQAALSSFSSFLFPFQMKIYIYFYQKSELLHIYVFFYSPT